MNLKVYDMSGKEVSSIDVSDAVFGHKPNRHLLHAAVLCYLANQRQGTQSTLTRTEVRGGGRKPWRQKGTGHARQGSIRAPQWKHGGVALGPKPRDYSYELNRKQRKLAICHALSDKAKNGDLIIVDNISLAGYKTRPVADMLTALNAAKKPLIVTAASEPVIVKSAGNLPGVATAQSGAICAYQILKHDKLVVTRDAVARLEEVFA